MMRIGSSRTFRVLAVAAAVTLAGTVFGTEAYAQRGRGSRGGGRGGGRVVAGPRVAPRGVVRGRRSVVVVRGSYYSPYYGWGGFYGPYGPYGYGYPYYYGGRYDGSASVRVQVTPREAEVFVDGYLAGRVDDFDGIFQRLNVIPGNHEIAIYSKGFRTYRENVYLGPSSSHKVQLALAPLRAGEVSGPPPEPLDVEPPRDFDPGRRPLPRGQRAPSDVPTTRGPVAREPAEAAQFGTLTVRVRPFDAEVQIDDETWFLPAADEALVIQLPVGLHSIEIERDGYRIYRTSVVVRAGERAPLDVDLTPR